MMYINKVLFSFVTILLFLLFVGFNIGKWIDVTEEPIQSDIIVCLGGGTIERVKKSIELVERGYADKEIFLLLGESWYNQPYIKNNYPHLAVIIDESPKNTKEEVFFIKQYMYKHGYKSALIVTDPPHSRRISLLNTLLFLEGDAEMIFHIIGSDVKWWDREYYYNNQHARNAVVHESIRIVYSFIVYGILDKIGLLDEMEEWIKGIKS